MTDSIKQRLVSADDMRMNGFAAVADTIDAQAARIAELERECRSYQAIAEDAINRLDRVRDEAKAAKEPTT